MTPADSRALLASLPEGATPGPLSAEDRVLVGAGKDERFCAIVSPGLRLYLRIERASPADKALLIAAPSLRDHLTAALDREARLRAILAECAMAVGDVQISDADANDLYRRIKAALASGVSDV